MHCVSYPGVSVHGVQGCVSVHGGVRGVCPYPHTGYTPPCKARHICIYRQRAAYREAALAGLHAIPQTGECDERQCDERPMMRACLYDWADDLSLDWADDLSLGPLYKATHALLPSSPPPPLPPSSLPVRNNSHGVCVARLTGRGGVRRSYRQPSPPNMCMACVTCVWRVLRGVDAYIDSCPCTNTHSTCVSSCLTGRGACIRMYVCRAPSEPAAAGTYGDAYGTYGTYGDVYGT